MRNINERYADEFESLKSISEIKEKIYTIIGQPKKSS
jgi:hypothetical protein